MRQLLIILAVFYCCNLHGQITNETILILQSDATLKYNQNKLIYTTLADGINKKEIIETISNKILYKYEFSQIDNSRIIIDSIILTGNEVENILDNVLNQDTTQWLSSYLPNTKYIAWDTLSNIFNSDQDAWKYFHEKHDWGYCTLLKPIFLRDNTICIYYSDFHCGITCGGGSLYIYIKQNGVWKVFTELVTWIS